MKQFCCRRFEPCLLLLILLLIPSSALVADTDAKPCPADKNCSIGDEPQPALAAC